MRITASLMALILGGCLGSCTFGGSLKTPQEALGFPNYGKPPGVRIQKSCFGAKAEVSSDAAAKLQKLTLNPETGQFELDGLDVSTNVTPLVTQLGANATAIKDQYAVYTAAHTKEAELQAQEVAAGLQAGADIAKAIAPLLTAPASPAKSAGLLAGLLGGGVEPTQLIGLLGQLTGSIATPSNTIPAPTPK